MFRHQQLKRENGNATSVVPAVSKSRAKSYPDNKVEKTSSVEGA